MTRTDSNIHTLPRRVPSVGSSPGSFLFVGPDPESDERVLLAITDGVVPTNWPSLDIEAALERIHAFLEDMEDGDGVIHHTDLPDMVLAALEGSHLPREGPVPNIKTGDQGCATALLIAGV